MIRPIFANTAWVSIRRGVVMRGGGWRKIRLRVRCGLILHPRLGPVLIDAGCGPRTTSKPGRSMPLRTYASVLRYTLNPLESPLACLADHGYMPEDVKLVIATHLHADHVSYFKDLPKARFVVDGLTKGQLRHGVFDELLPDDFAERCSDMRGFDQITLPFGLGRGFDLLGDGAVLGVPLPGHAPGHFGLCFPGATPLLYATDVQWLRQAVIEDRMPGFPAALTANDPQALRQSTDLARSFVQAGGDLLLCHDPEPTAYDWTPSDV